MRRKWLPSLAAVVLMTTTVLLAAPIPASATTSDEQFLSQWTLQVSVKNDFNTTEPYTYEQVETADYTSVPGGSMSWDATFDERTEHEGSCGKSTSVGTGSGSGTGAMQLTTMGFSPAAFGLAEDQDWTSVFPSTDDRFPVEFSVSYESPHCSGHSSSDTRLPAWGPVFLPGTLEDLAALPAGTVLQDEYVEQGNVYTGGGIEVSYTATKTSLDCGAGAPDADNDGIADACEVIDAADDNAIEDPSVISTAYTDGLTLDVLANDTGDVLRIVSVLPVGHDEGTVNVSPSRENVTWSYANVPPGIYQFRYTIRDLYGKQDSALITVRVDCAPDNTSTDHMQWTAGLDVPGKFIHLFVLDADFTYCTDDGNITDFELTPSVKETAGTVLAFFGFDPQVGDVTYMPSRNSYPAMVVTGTVRFDMCFSPLVLLNKVGGKELDRFVTKAVQRHLGRNLRVSGEWTQADLQLALNSIRDDLLDEVGRLIRKNPLARGSVGDFVVGLAQDALSTALNEVISDVAAAAGPAGLYGKTPDEVAVWAAKQLRARFVPQICEALRVWEPVVEIVGRPVIGPSIPSRPVSLYTNDFLSVRLTS